MESEGIAALELRQFVECIERLEEEKAQVSDGIKQVFAVAWGGMWLAAVLG